MRNPLRCLVFALALLAPLHASAQLRSVRFLATADPQIWVDCGPTGIACECPGSMPDANDSAYATIDTMQTARENDSSIRGIMIAGDLTQSGLQEEFEIYLGWNTAGSGHPNGVSWLFDGYGNHDIDGGDPGYDQTIFAHVRHHGRVTTVKHHPTNSANNEPHYSWDWDDVHFLQLNLFPGDLPTPGGSSGSLKDPKYALNFLMADLEYRLQLAGNPDRPVVLMYHYDNSSNWWTNAQRVAFWNAIRDYNVVAILTGHNHLNAQDLWEDNFDRPLGALARPDQRPMIRGYNVSAARGDGFVSGSETCVSYRNGSYTEFFFNFAQELHFIRRDQYSTPTDTGCVTLRNDFYVDTAYQAGPQAGTKGDPLSSLFLMNLAASVRNPSCADHNTTPTVYTTTSSHTFSTTLNQPMTIRGYTP